MIYILVFVAGLIIGIIIGRWSMRRRFGDKFREFIDYDDS